MRYSKKGWEGSVSYFQESSVGKDEIKVQAAARRKKMAISVESRAAVTEPEKYIRDIRRIKK